MAGKCVNIRPRIHLSLQMAFGFLYVADKRINKRIVMKNKLFTLLSFALLCQFSTANAGDLPPTKKVSVVRPKITIDALTKNVEFKFCKSAVTDDDQTQLNELADFLNANKYAIALRGHADAIGTYVGNWKMSEARAVAIKNYLVKKGIAEDRIVTTAFGSTIPIADNKTSRGRQKNRRVEIRLKETGM